GSFAALCFNVEQSSPTFYFGLRRIPGASCSLGKELAINVALPPLWQQRWRNDAKHRGTALRIIPPTLLPKRRQRNVYRQFFTKRTRGSRYSPQTKVKSWRTLLYVKAERGERP